MWLLQTENMELCEFYKDFPKYAILSHRWEEQELSFENVGRMSSRNLKGYHKVKEFCQQARQSGFDYVWVDTCCINKLSSAELNEAINSMYKWYEEAAVCYAYLSDVTQQQDLEKSAWFCRGWTLQELLAPREVYFFTRTWELVASRKELAPKLETITGIPHGVLCKSMRIADFCIAVRMSWSALRETTRVEDRAYCLLGIFDVNMPLLYGEGEKAFQRLQEEIMKVSTDLSLFLWQGRPCERFGMLAASPSGFVNLPDCLADPCVQEKYKLIKGWTVNNAAMSLNAMVWPYYLTKDFKEIYALFLHEPNKSGITEGLCIFIEKKAAHRVDSLYRRAVLDDRTWDAVTWSDRHKYNPLFPQQQSLLISREPLVECRTGGICGIYLSIQMKRRTMCIARVRDAKRPNHRLCNWSLAKHDPSSENFGCCFDAGPRDPIIGIYGHVTLAVVKGVQLLACFGLDNSLRLICLAVFFSEQLYNGDLPAVKILRAHLALLPHDDARMENFDKETYVFAFRSGKLRLTPHTSVDGPLGFDITVARGFEPERPYKVQLYFDPDKFLAHYLPGLDLAAINGHDELPEGSSEQLQALESNLNNRRGRLFD